MNNFWEWMIEEGYGYEGFYIKLLDFSYDYFPVPKQMLIGYMLEYIREHKNFDLIEERLDYVAAHSNIYDQLEEIIKELDN